VSDAVDVAAGTRHRQVGLSPCSGVGCGSLRPFAGISTIPRCKTSRRPLVSCHRPSAAPLDVPDHLPALESITGGFGVATQGCFRDGRLLPAGRIDRHRRCISSLVMIDIVWRVTRRVRRNATCQESAPARGGERATPHLISSFSLSGRAGSVALRSGASCALLTLQPLRAPVMALDLSMRT
jgi:hypothetical protein